MIDRKVIFFNIILKYFYGSTCIFLPRSQRRYTLLYKFPSGSFESCLKHSGTDFALCDELIILTLCGRDDNDEISSKRLRIKVPDENRTNLGGVQWITACRKCDCDSVTTPLRFMVHNKFHHISAATVTYLYLTITYARTIELYSPVGYGATVQCETVKL